MSRSSSVKKFDFLRQFSKATEKTMFCYVSVLYWTESKKFVDSAQQCFSFTTCVQLKPKIRMLTTYPDLDKISPRAFWFLRNLIYMGSLLVSKKIKSKYIHMCNNNQNFSHSTFCCWIIQFASWSILFSRHVAKSKNLGL